MCNSNYVNCGELGVGDYSALRTSGYKIVPEKRAEKYAKSRITQTCIVDSVNLVRRYIVGLVIKTQNDAGRGFKLQCIEIVTFSCLDIK